MRRNGELTVHRNGDGGDDGADGEDVYRLRENPSPTLINRFLENPDSAIPGPRERVSKGKKPFLFNFKIDFININ